MSTEPRYSIEYAASKPLRELEKALADASDEAIVRLRSDWRFWARPNQLPPDGDWTIWLCLTGRGWGKNRTLAEWAHLQANEHPGSHGFIAARTLGDARETVLFHQESGILTLSKPTNPCEFIGSRRLVQWSNGSFAHIYTSEEPDLARGPQHDWGIADEIATWKRTKDIRGNTTWENLRFGLRGMKCGRPRMVAGTTPRPTTLILSLLEQARSGRSVAVTRGTMYENAANLSEAFLEQIEHDYGGTRIGRAEIMGEVLEDIEGAIVTREMLEELRVKAVPQDVQLRAGAVAVDPGEASSSHAGTGIVAGAVGTDGVLYVLQDRTGRHAPLQWARKAVDARDAIGADVIVAEKNYGGEMVKQTIRTVDEQARVIMVAATRGKHVRFGPVGALFEQGRIKLVGSFPALEDQIVQFTDIGYEGDSSPHNADALVWLAYHLIVKQRGRTNGSYDFSSSGLERVSPWSQC